MDAADDTVGSHSVFMPFYASWRCYSGRNNAPQRLGILWGCDHCRFNCRWDWSLVISTWQLYSRTAISNNTIHQMGNWNNLLYIYWRYGVELDTFLGRFLPSTHFRRSFVMIATFMTRIPGFALAFFATSTFAQDAVTSADVRCVVVGMQIAGSTAGTEQTMGGYMTMYYMGRLNGRGVKGNIEQLVIAEVKKM